MRSATHPQQGLALVGFGLAAHRSRPLGQGGRLTGTRAACRGRGWQHDALSHFGGGENTTRGGVSKGKRMHADELESSGSKVAAHRRGEAEPLATFGSHGRVGHVGTSHLLGVVSSGLPTRGGVDCDELWNASELIMVARTMPTDLPV